jgi:hypothetical protein
MMLQGLQGRLTQLIRSSSCIYYFCLCLFNQVHLMLLMDGLIDDDVFVSLAVYKKHVVVEEVSTRGIDGDQSADVSDEEGASRPSVSCLFFYVKQKERRDDALTSVQQDIRLPQITLLLTIIQVA